MATEAEGLLNRGLLAGYAGEIVPKPAFRGTLPIKVISFVENEGLDSQRGVYRDEWLAASSGGGQEVALSVIDNSTFTRLYAGGVTTDEEILRELSTGEEEITGRLKDFIVNAKGATRGRVKYSADIAEWHYEYEVLRNLRKRIDLTIALETMSYHNELVFAHGFLLSPVVFKPAPAEEI